MKLQVSVLRWYKGKLKDNIFLRINLVKWDVTVLWFCRRILGLKTSVQSMGYTFTSNTYFFLTSESLQIPPIVSQFTEKEVLFLKTLLKQLAALLDICRKSAEHAVTGNNQPTALCIIVFHGYHEKDVYQLVRGRQHNSQGLSLFFLRMSLGASLARQRGRLHEEKKEKQCKLIRITEPVFGYIIFQS